MAPRRTRHVRYAPGRIMQTKAVNTTFAYLRLCWYESDSWSVRLNPSSTSPEAVSKKSLHHRTPAAFGIVNIVAMIGNAHPSFPRGIPARKTSQDISRPSCRICIQIKAANWPQRNWQNSELKWTDRIPGVKQHHCSATATKELTESWRQKPRKSKRKTWLRHGYDTAMFELWNCTHMFSPWRQVKDTLCRRKHTRSVEGQVSQCFTCIL